MILDKRPASEIKRAAREEGMTFLRESAVEKVRAGVTTLREINKVTFIEGDKRPAMLTRTALKSLLLDPPPAMAFEVSEAGHRGGAHRRPHRAGFPAARRRACWRSRRSRKTCSTKAAFAAAVKALATAHAGA